MMTRIALALAAALALSPTPSSAIDTAVVGQPAPAFSLADSHGINHELASFKGKVVVLEWINFDCPFVKKHYDTGNLPKLQQAYGAKGVVWLSINSSAPGKQGNYPPEKVNALTKEKGWAAAAYLLDTDGTVGRAYGAKTTPHMFIIDKEGKLVYAGGIDDKPSTDPADVPAAANHVKAALDEILAGKAVTTATSQPYGCSVKY